MTKQITAMIMVVITALLIGWDVVVAVNDTPGDTISEIIMNTSYKWSIIPLSFGVLMGHFFWNVENNKNKNIKIVILAAIGVSVLMSNIWCVFPINPLLVFVVGVPLGRWLWPLRHK